MRGILLGLMAGVALAISTSETLCADARALTPLGEGIRVLLSEKKDISRDKRTLVAEAFVNQCGAMNAKVPALSPRESDWLESEINAGRIVGALRSAEYAQREAKAILAGCEQSALIVRNAINSQSEALEACAWSFLLGAILDTSFEEHVQYLKKTRTATFTDQDVEASGLFAFAAGVIVRKIVTPMLGRSAGIPPPAQ